MSNKPLIFDNAAIGHPKFTRQNNTTDLFFDLFFNDFLNYRIRDKNDNHVFLL